MKEKWKEVEGFEGLYAVSTLGRVKSLCRYRVCGRGGAQLIPERIMQTNTDDNGYLSVVFCKQGIRYRRLVHRLVAEAFIPNPHNKPQVNHNRKDGDKSKNTVYDLEWSTSKENHKHAHANGLGLKGSRIGTSKLTEEDIPEIRSRIVAGESPMQIYKDYNLDTPGAIWCIKYNKSWRHVK